jgi:hypothetical protein
MDALSVGADVATMLTGLSVVTATIVWGEKQLREHRERKAVTAERNWGGYIAPNGINSWDVVLAEDPDLPPGRVVLDVVTAGASQTSTWRITSAPLDVRHAPRFLLGAPIMELLCAAPLWIRPGRLGSLGSGRSVCRTPSCRGPRPRWR